MDVFCYLHYWFVEKSLTRAERDLLRQKIDAARRKERGLVEGEIEWYHGTETGYRWKKCKCDKCRIAASHKRKIRKNKQKEKDPLFHKRQYQKAKIRRLEWTSERLELRREKKRLYDKEYRKREAVRLRRTAWERANKDKRNGYKRKSRKRKKLERSGS